MNMGQELMPGTPGAATPTGKTVCACKHLFFVFIVSLACFVAIRPRPAASLIIHLVW